MDDTTVEFEILRQMPPARKIAVMNSLIRQAWVLRAAAVREDRPDLDRAEVEALARATVAGEGT